MKIRVLFVFDNMRIIINFGINPVSGGSPPSERIKIAIVIKFVFLDFAIFVNCFDDITFILFIVINSGIINEQ